MMGICCFLFSLWFPDDFWEEGVMLSLCLHFKSFCRRMTGHGQPKLRLWQVSESMALRHPSRLSQTLVRTTVRQWQGGGWASSLPLLQGHSSTTSLEAGDTFLLAVCSQTPELLMPPPPNDRFGKPGVSGAVWVRGSPARIRHWEGQASLRDPRSHQFFSRWLTKMLKYLSYNPTIDACFNTDFAVFG